MEHASHSADLTPTVAKPKANVDTVWNFSCVTFQAEDTLFSVLKQGFLAPGSPFEAMFALSPTGEPIMLENTSALDFRALLGVMYPQESGSKISQDEWLGALRLAHKWQFGKIRDKAIANLQPEISEWTPDQKINLGLQFLVQDWVRAGLVDLVQNQELEMDNLMKDPYSFDQYIVTKIFYVQNDSYVYPEWDALYLKAARKLVDSVFADELKKARHPDDKPESEFVEGAAPRGIKRVSEPQSEKSLNELSQMRFRRDNVVETSQGGRKRRSLAS